MVITEYNTFLKSGGIFQNQKGFIKVSGPDSRGFLHRITTQDIKSLESGMGTAAAILEPTAAIISLFDLYCCGQFFLLVVDQEQRPVLLSALEKFHFSEDLEISDETDEYTFLSIQGPKISSSVKAALGRISTRLNEIIGLEECLVVAKEDFNKSTAGFHLFIKNEHLSTVTRNLETQKLKPLSLDLWGLLRLDSGHFFFGTDLNKKNIILEAGLSSYVARDKGCYPGQEVVERIFTYGNIAKKLMGLRIVDGQQVKEDLRLTKLLRNKEDAGYVTSLRVIPWSGKILGFGMVRKPFFEPEVRLELDNLGAEVAVTAVPDSFHIQRPVAKAPL